MSEASSGFPDSVIHGVVSLGVKLAFHPNHTVTQGATIQHGIRHTHFANLFRIYSQTDSFKFLDYLDRHGPFRY
jgi:hypothetical protein